MATWDNCDMLVNFIRHSFITCDDTGVCEAVLEQPEVSDKPGAIRLMTSNSENSSNRVDGDYDSDSSHDLPHSPDIHVDVGHRRRSETSKRLETLKQQRAVQNKIQTVQWKNVDNAKANLENVVFEKKEIFKRKKPAKSAVTEKLKACDSQPSNPFSEYTKFDANVSLGSAGRLVRVFLTMLDNFVLRQKPLEINVINTARVSELIGLICYQYSNLNYFPPLSLDIGQFCLYVAEDNGEIDSDLPARNHGENVSRFHFPFLALVQKSSQSKEETSRLIKKHNVIVHTVIGQTFEFEFDSLDAPLQSLKDKAVEKRNAGQNIPRHQIMDYNLEKLAEPGVALQLENSIASTCVSEFCLIRANSIFVSNFIRNKRIKSPSTSHDSGVRSFVKQRSSTATHFYTVSMIQKFKREIPIQMSICTDRIEVVPIIERKNSAAGRFLNTLQRSTSLRAGKGVTISLDDLGGAEIIEEKSGGHKIFRIVHRSSSSGEWKSHQFDGDGNVVDEIVLHLNMCLDSSKSESRSEFVRRTPRKVSLFKRLQFSDQTGNEPTV